MFGQINGIWVCKRKHFQFDVNRSPVPTGHPTKCLNNIKHKLDMF